MLYNFLILLILTSNFCVAQCISENKSFQSGEKISYKVSYHLGFIWTDAGEAHFDIDTTTYFGQKIYYFNSYGTSLPQYDWFFKVRDSYKSFVDAKTFQPYKFERNVSEGNRELQETYVFDYFRKKVKIFGKNKTNFYQDSLNISLCSFDVLTAIYFIRCLDFEKYKENDKIYFSLVLENQVYNIYIRFAGKENVKLPDDREFRCIKFYPYLVEGTIFRGGEGMTVWVSDDENKIPILVEAEILVGKVKAILQNATGLRNEFRSKIK